MKFWILLPLSATLGFIFWLCYIPAAILLSIIGIIEEITGTESNLDLQFLKTKICYTSERPLKLEKLQKAVYEERALLLTSNSEYVRETVTKAVKDYMSRFTESTGPR